MADRNDDTTIVRQSIGGTGAGDRPANEDNNDEESLEESAPDEIENGEDVVRAPGFRHEDRDGEEHDRDCQEANSAAIPRF